jgi:hypothetical protein
VLEHRGERRGTYIHRQPASPPTPFIFTMAYASKPEKAPATEAALKKSPCR